MSFLRDFLKISEVNTLLYLLTLVFAIIIIVFIWKNTKSWTKTLIAGAMIGIIVAIVFSALNNWDTFVATKQDQTNENTDAIWKQEITYWSNLVTQVFYNSISILLPFVLFASIIVSIINYGAIKAKKQIWTGFIRLFIVYLIGIIITVLISLIILEIDFQGFFPHLPSEANKLATIIPLGEKLVNFIPTSINDFFNISHVTTNLSETQSMGGSVSGIISAVLIGLVFGISLFKLRRKNPHSKVLQQVENGIIGFHKVVNEILELVIKYLPFAIIGFITNSVFQGGIKQILNGITFIGFMFLILFIIVFVLSGMNFIFLQKKNIKSFASKISAPLIMGFFTQSSQATLPLTQKLLKKELMISHTVADFVPTFAASGLSIACTGAFPLLTSIVIAKQLGMADELFYIQAIIIITILSFGMAGVPGDAAVASTSAIKSLFNNATSLNMLAIILSTDLISEMARTSTNIYGAITASIWTNYALNKKQTKLTKIRE